MNIPSTNRLLWTLISVVGVVTLAGSSWAEANVCDEGNLRSGISAVGLHRSNQTVARRACPQTEVRLGGHLQTTFNPYDYGIDVVSQIGAGEPLYSRLNLRLSGSYVVVPGLELFASTEALQVRFGISGYQGLYWGLGDTNVGASLLVYSDKRFALSGFLRSTLPTAVFLYRNAWPVAVETGAAWTFAAARDLLHFHGTLSGQVEAGLPHSVLTPRSSVFAALGAELRLWDRLSLSLDGQGLSHFDELSLVHSTGIASAISYRAYEGLHVILEGRVPLGGENQNLFAARAALAYTF